MKKTLLLTVLLFSLISLTFIPLDVFAQGMMNWNTNSNITSSEVSATAQDEAKGKQIWEQLQSQQTTCSNLKDDDFEVLGEYFMGQSIGNTERHAAMNQMMQNMMGQNGEEQMHITLGKRSTGCDTNATLPSGYNFIPMMWMMGGGGNPMMGYDGWGNMMGWGFGIGWVFMIIFWVLIILGVVALVRYLAKSGSDKESNAPLNVLKERYAKGEINKKEFEEMKKDLS